MIFHVQRGRKKTEVYGYLCMDDYGNAVYRCRYTDEPVAAHEGRIAGNIVPQAQICYVAKHGTEALEKQSRQHFHEYEANCNMCRHFNRHAYDKKQFAISGVFYGDCAAHKKHGTFMVAPDDWMGMQCWEPRT